MGTCILKVIEQRRRGTCRRKRTFSLEHPSLRNDDIIKLTGAKLSDTVIIETINSGGRMKAGDDGEGLAGAAGD